MSRPTKVSLCVITLNEADNIQRCLQSVPFAAEKIVLDSHSTDATVSLAEQHGAKVWIEDFRGHVQQKQRALELASQPWVLCLDADEELSPELSAEIQALLARGPERDGYELPRKTNYLGQFIEHSGWWPEYRLRLFDRSKGHWAGANPHDHVELNGTRGRLRAPLYHYNYRSLSHHLETVNRYTTTMAAEKLAAGKRFRARDLIFRPPGRFLKMYVLRRGFLDGWRGLVLASIAAFYVFSKYAKMWEAEHGSKPRSIHGETGRSPHE